MSAAPVVIAAGGTGGHVVPALAVAEALAIRHVPVIWIGTRQGLEARLVPTAGIDIRWIDVVGLRGKGIVGTLFGPLRLLRACWQSLALLMQLQPRAVLGMGGFVSGPVGLMALLLRRPLVLHEQNAIAGMTNRRLARFATTVLTAWPNVFADSVAARDVGNPVRRDIAKLAERRTPEALLGSAEVDATDGSTGVCPEAPDSAPLRLLVVGGSRGARILNETVPAALARLSRPVRVRHQSGDVEASAVRARYAELCERADGIRVDPFIEDMAAAYAETDLVICRSGAMTVTELAALACPSILVPFPHAVDDHQSANARRLADAGGAVCIDQTDFSAERLATEIATVDDDRSRLREMSASARRCFREGAAEAVADALIAAASSNGRGATTIDATREAGR